jgi:hypothetical protein
MRNLLQLRIRNNHQHTPWDELWRQPLAVLIRMPWWLFFPMMILIDLAVILAFAVLLSFDRCHLLGEAPMGIPGRACLRLKASSPIASAA